MSMNKNGTLGIIIALSIAMVGATVVVSYGALQVEAAKSGAVVNWCYDSSGVECFPNHGECTKAQQDDQDAHSGCFKSKFDQSP
jgi:hypothetical protein